MNLYQNRGLYHKNLDKNWSYYPMYIAKMKYIKNLLKTIPEDAKIFDAGCGEGVLVQAMKKQKLDAIGMDLDYSDEKHVIKGDILKTHFKNATFDYIFCLDVIEDFTFKDQAKLLREFHRILKKNGQLILSIPNLAHCYSRLHFLLKGTLVRTAKIEKHPGDRPIKEYIELIKQHKFKILKRKGIFPTFPILFNLYNLFGPKRTTWLINIFNYFAPPGLSFLNIVICKK